MTEQTGIEPKRGPGRPPLRPDTKRVPLRERLRGKTRKYTISSDRFFIADEDKPEGVDFNWKRFSVQGQEDPYYISNMRQQGWEPVDAEDMPNLAPEGATGPIIKDGMILMARPMELTMQSRKELEALSKRQVTDREKQMGIAPTGHAQRSEPAITKELMRPVPVEED